MSCESATVLMLLVLMTGTFLTAIAWMRHRQAMARITATKSEPANLQQVAALEARLRVVERIVTDGGYDLSDQIEAAP